MKVKIYEVTALHVDKVGEYDYTLFSRFFKRFKNAFNYKKSIRKYKFDNDIVVKLIRYTNKEFEELQKDVKIKLTD